MSTATVDKLPSRHTNSQELPLGTESLPRERRAVRQPLQPGIPTAPHLIPPAPEHTQTEVAQAEVEVAVHQAKQALAKCSHLNYASLRIDGTQQRIILRGEVRSFFHKQLAQEAILQTPGIASVCNQLHVLGR